jgi:hypothetical protein
MNRDQLTNMLSLVKAFPDCKFFPLHTPILYWKCAVGIRLYIKPLNHTSVGNPNIYLDFQGHSLTKLKKLASWVGVRYDSTIGKPELLGLLKARLVSATTLQVQIQREIRKMDKKEKARKAQEKARQAQIVEEQKLQRLEDERQGQLVTEKLATFRANFSLDNAVERYAKYLLVRDELDLETFDVDVDVDEVKEELRTAPATYQLLLEIQERYEQLSESDRALRQKVERIQEMINDRCRCGYSSAGSYLGGDCHCGYGYGNGSD